MRSCPYTQIQKYCHRKSQKLWIPHVLLLIVDTSRPITAYDAAKTEATAIGHEQSFRSMAHKMCIEGRHISFLQ